MKRPTSKLRPVFAHSEWHIPKASVYRITVRSLKSKVMYTAATFNLLINQSVRGLAILNVSFQVCSLQFRICKGITQKIFTSFLHFKDLADNRKK